MLISTFLNNYWTRNYFYTRLLALLLLFKQKFRLSNAEALRNINFLPHFYKFSQWMRCAIFTPSNITPSNLAKYQYCHRRDYIHPSFRKNIGALHRKHFSKHPLFTTFSIFSTVGEVCNIQNKYWLPHKSWTYLETSTFYCIWTSFHSVWGVQYFKQISKFVVNL